jgi:hypothetical protein
MTQNLKQDDVFAAALTLYAAAQTDRETRDAENALIAAMKTAKTKSEFRDATRVITLIAPQDPRAAAVMDALAENTALLDDVRLYVAEKPKRVGAKLRSGALEGADSALSPDHLRVLGFYVAQATQKKAALTL